MHSGGNNRIVPRVQVDQCTCRRKADDAAGQRQVERQREMTVHQQRAVELARESVGIAKRHRSVMILFSPIAALLSALVD